MIIILEKILGRLLERRFQGDQFRNDNFWRRSRGDQFRDDNFREDLGEII